MRNVDVALYMDWLMLMSCNQGGSRKKVFIVLDVCLVEGSDFFKISCYLRKKLMIVDGGCVIIFSVDLVNKKNKKSLYYCVFLNREFECGAGGQYPVWSTLNVTSMSYDLCGTRELISKREEFSRYTLCL